MIKYYFTIILLFLIIVGCAVQQPIVKEEKAAALKVPAGVDTLTAMIADSIFSQVMISEDEEGKAQSLFEDAQEIAHLADSLWESSVSGLFNREDTLLTLQQLSRAQDYLNFNPERFKQTKKAMKKMGKLNSGSLGLVSNELMLQALGFYENAIRTNRFEINYRRRFGQFLKQLADKSKDKTYLIRAGEELEKVVYFIKGEQQLFHDLGEVYFRLGDWNNAFKNYALAQNALRKTAIFAVQDPKVYFARINDVPIDTTRIVYYLDKQGTCKTKLYEAQPALALYREAKAITPEKDSKEFFESKIKWILWDDGNIHASELRDRADSLRGYYKNYLAAKNLYLELLPILWTKRTKDEINWRIAYLDYDLLGNKFDGIARMRTVIKNSATDSLTGAPLDSTYHRYFDDYGRMSFTMGTDNLKKDRLSSYIYFSQAAATNYNERGKAFLQLAGMSVFDPHETISLCNKSMDFLNDFDNTEKQMLYEMLFKAYRKLGDFATAKLWFDRWKAL